jgi:hypothetical protein
MPVVATNTEAFSVPTATREDLLARTADDKVLVPSIMGTAAAADKEEFASIGNLRGYLSGGTMSRHAVTLTTLNVAAFVATDDGQSAAMGSTAGAIDFTEIGENGRDAGTAGIPAASTWYHIFAIGKEDGTVARLASLSPTAPSMPADYVYKRRLGSWKTDGSGNLCAIRQSGNKFVWPVQTNDYVGTNPGTAAILASLNVPSGVQIEAILSFYLQANDGVRRGALVTSPLDTDTVADAGFQSSISAGTPTVGGSSQAEFRRDTNTSRQVRFRLDGSGANTNVIISTVGWIDAL